jgi:hypothetical protein
MKNAWKVIWVEEGRKRRKWFEGSPDWAEKHIVYEKPLEAAVAFAKELKKKGLSPEVVSARKAFIQTKDQLRPPGPNYIWCPYCVKWRVFRLLKVKRGDWVGAGANRCPVCYITDSDYHVRRYNGRISNLSAAEIQRRLTKR